MQQLSELQRQLAASLARGADAPADVKSAQLAHARGGLEAKRRRAAGHLLPALRAVLGTAWREAFHRHALSYVPSGLLYHVDDAWELAATLAGDGERVLRVAARADLLPLRIRFVRSRRRGPFRVRERRTPLVALTAETPRALVVWFPGKRPCAWRFVLRRLLPRYLR